MAERLIRILIPAALLLVFPFQPGDGRASAQQQGTGVATDGRTASPTPGSAFRAVPGAKSEQTSGFFLMVAAYGLIWFLVLAYVVRLARLQANSEQEQRRLERLLGREKQSPPGGE
jgi:hypothetical protein